MNEYEADKISMQGENEERMYLYVFVYMFEVG